MSTADEHKPQEQEDVMLPPKRDCKCAGCKRKEKQMRSRLERAFPGILASTESKEQKPEDKKWLSEHLREAVADMHAREAKE